MVDHFRKPNRRKRKNCCFRWKWYETSCKCYEKEKQEPFQVCVCVFVFAEWTIDGGNQWIILNFEKKRLFALLRWIFFFLYYIYIHDSWTKNSEPHKKESLIICKPKEDEKLNWVTTPNRNQIPEPKCVCEKWEKTKKDQISLLPT